MLPDALSYPSERRAFYQSHAARLEALGFTQGRETESTPTNEASRLAREQQRHSDWFADNPEGSYNDFAGTPFWRAVDESHFSRWRPLLAPGQILLEVGCAQGRSTFAFAGADLDIVGFDLSRRLVRQAVLKYRTKGPWRARISFVLADADAVPAPDGTYDAVLVYGVLHHVPRPGNVCREVLRVLRPGGWFFGSENNHTAFRALFDFLMKVAPLWKEEAGPESLISERKLREWFGVGGPLVSHASIGTCVYLPPHFVNALPASWSTMLVSLSDRVGQALPFFRGNGGLIFMTLRKQDQVPS